VHRIGEGAGAAASATTWGDEERAVVVVVVISEGVSWDGVEPFSFSF